MARNYLWWNGSRGNVKPLSFGTCPKMRGLLHSLSHFLPPFLSLTHSLVTFSASRCLSLCLTSLHPYPPFPSHFSRFCLLNFHLSAEQIPLQLPKLCQKALSVFLYIFLLLLFSGATSSLNSNCAGWNRLITIWAEPRGCIYISTLQIVVNRSIR